MSCSCMAESFSRSQSVWKEHGEEHKTEQAAPSAELGQRWQHRARGAAKEPLLWLL